MLKISAVIITTSLFAGLLASGPSGLATESVAQIAPAIESVAHGAMIKVRTFVVRETAGVTLAAQFELPRAERTVRTRYMHLRRPSVASKVRSMRGA